MVTLTKRQKEVLDFIMSYQEKKKYAPSLEEMRKKLGLASVSTAHFHVSKLRDLGYLSKKENKPRAINILDRSSLTQIPLMGIIAAGGPIEAIINSEPIEVPAGMLPKGSSCYALKVSGLSMIEEGISDGDIVLIKEQATINDGEKAVVYLPEHNTVTLKKVYREGEMIKLVPANQMMKPFYVSDAWIQGKVLGVLRKEI